MNSVFFMSSYLGVVLLIVSHRPMFHIRSHDGGTLLE